MLYKIIVSSNLSILDFASMDPSLFFNGPPWAETSGTHDFFVQAFLASWLGHEPVDAVYWSCYSYVLSLIKPAKKM